MEVILLLFFLLNISNDIITDIQPIYMIPNNVDVNRSNIITDIIADTANWYNLNFGRTFKYSDVKIMNVAETPEDIMAGMYDLAGANAAEFASRRVFDSFPVETQKHTMYIIFVEIDIWVARGAGGYAVLGGKEINGYNQDNKLFPLAHEVFHMFGIHHTPETVECINISLSMHNDISLTYTFMNSTILLELGYPVEDYQVELLTNPNYHTECLLLAYPGQPHPSTYLHCVRNPDINNDGRVDIGDLASILVNWGDCVEIYCPYDLNCDKIFDIADIAIALINFH